MCYSRADGKNTSRCRTSTVVHSNLAPFSGWILLAEDCQLRATLAREILWTGETPNAADTCPATLKHAPRNSDTAMYRQASLPKPSAFMIRTAPSTWMARLLEHISNSPKQSHRILLYAAHCPDQCTFLQPVAHRKLVTNINEVRTGGIEATLAKRK